MFDRVLDKFRGDGFLNGEALVPLRVLGCLGEVQVGRVQKITFLVEDCVGFSVDYSFKSYDFGPKSRVLVRCLDRLEREGLVVRRVERTFSGDSKVFYELSDEGRVFLERVDEEFDFGCVDDVIEGYSDYSFLDLVGEIYDEFPEWDERMDDSVYRKW